MTDARREQRQDVTDYVVTLAIWTISLCVGALVVYGTLWKLSTHATTIILLTSGALAWIIAVTAGIRRAVKTVLTGLVERVDAYPSTGTDREGSQ